MILLPALPVDPLLQPATPTNLEALLTMVRQLYAIDHIPFDEAAVRVALDALLREPTAGQVKPRRSFLYTYLQSE